MLRDRRRVGAAWKPALSLIVAAWRETPVLFKVLRMRVHIEYAVARGVLEQVDGFLRPLPETVWAHKSDCGVRFG